jgi:hypothetical protein
VYAEGSVLSESDALLPLPDIISGILPWINLKIKTMAKEFLTLSLASAVRLRRSQCRETEEPPSQ